MRRLSFFTALVLIASTSNGLASEDWKIHCVDSKGVEFFANQIANGGTNELEFEVIEKGVTKLSGKYSMVNPGGRVGGMPVFRGEDGEQITLMMLEGKLDIVQFIVNVEARKAFVFRTCTEVL